MHIVLINIFYMHLSVSYVIYYYLTITYIDSKSHSDDCFPIQLSTPIPFLPHCFSFLSLPPFFTLFNSRTNSFTMSSTSNLEISDIELYPFSLSFFSFPLSDCS